LPKDIREIFDSRNGELCFVVGMGESIANAEKHLKERHPRAFTIAINRAIERVPADYWFWMDLDAYETSKDHPNAKAAIRCGVDLFKDHYDSETYIWERAGDPDKKGPEVREAFFKDVQAGKLAWNGVSAVGASSLAWHLGAFRIVFVGCENRMNEEYLKIKEAEDIQKNGKVTKNWRSIYVFTFARIAEALKNRAVWMHPKVMLADASHTGTEWGELDLPKTTIPQEFDSLDAFYKHLWATGGLPKKKQLIVRN
jgi:hypothetical protein